MRWEVGNTAVLVLMAMTATGKEELLLPEIMESPLLVQLAKLQMEIAGILVWLAPCRWRDEGYWCFLRLQAKLYFK